MSQSGKIQFNGVFEERNPEAGKCSLCGKASQDLTAEQRRTGPGKAFSYPLCPVCRELLIRQTKDSNPEVLACYVRFVDEMVRAMSMRPVK